MLSNVLFTFFLFYSHKWGRGGNLKFLSHILLFFSTFSGENISAEDDQIIPASKRPGHSRRDFRTHTGCLCTFKKRGHLKATVIKAK